MKLTFKSRYKSIRELPTADLPSFVLLTGVNGVGKTHLLRAIENGAILADVVKDPKADVRYFDWASLVPNDATQVASNGLYQERDQILHLISQSRALNEERMSQILANPLLRKWPLDGWQLARLSAEKWASEFGGGPESETIRHQLDVLVQHASNQVVQNLGAANPVYARVRAVAAENKTAPVLLEYKHFSGKHIGWGNVDLFQQSFGQLFLAYLEQQKLNRLYRMESADGRMPAEQPLSDEDFAARHGEPPWDYVNRVLLGAGLDFALDRPEGWAQTVYWPQLTKRSTGAIVPFSALSSGEKVLMSFALCLYNSTDKRQYFRKPTLLLLDEVDAPLHPSMCRHLMTTITQTLVEREKMAVIMTTHSPSTIAVAPEESIFVIDRDRPGVRKARKAEALGILTSEIPTLSITFDGRRQVFVESDTDAELYELLYQVLKGQLESERSLVFIGAGRRPPSSSDKDAGCDQVKRVVAQLVDGGNSSVFGLLDWDGSRNPGDRIDVLGAGERYSIENCLLDPLLLAGVAIREKRTTGDLLKATETFMSLQSLSVERLQDLVDHVQRLVLKRTSSEAEPSHTVRYNGGFSLQLSQYYLQMNGHRLEEAAKEAFPELRRFHRAGDLLRHVAKTVAVELPRFVPVVFVDCFSRLLSG